MVIGPAIGRFSHNGAMAELRTVRLVRLPVSLFLRAREHHDDLLRELALIRIRQVESNDPPPLPAGLEALVGVAGRRYGRGIHPDVERDQALANGGPTVDLTYEVPPETADEIAVIDEFLDAADEFCRTEQLLTLPRESAVVEFSHWYCREFRRQCDGLPPTPWHGPVN